MSETDLVDKGRALLKSLVAEHDGVDAQGDHSWRQCRPCLAQFELAPGRTGEQEAVEALRAYLHWAEALHADMTRVQAGLIEIQQALREPL